MFILGEKTLPLNNSELYSKLQEVEVIINEKNAIEAKLNGQLKEMKEELQQERQTFAAELVERETRQQELEASKEELEVQLNALDRENYESVQQFGMLQERLQVSNDYRRIFVYIFTSLAYRISGFSTPGWTANQSVPDIGRTR